MISSVDLANSLKVRANIYKARNIVAAHVEGKIPRDWDGLEVLIKDQAKPSTDLHTALVEYLGEEIESNYKAVAIYRVTPESATNFIEFAASLSHPPIITYPAILSAAFLPKLSTEPVVASFLDDTEIVRLVMTRRRRFTLRKQIDASKLEKSAREALTIYDEIYGVSVYDWQIYDVITLYRSSNIIEIRADFTRAENAYQNSTQIDRSLSEAAGWLTYYSAIAKRPVNLGTAINLFPAIKHFTYENDGSISKLNFRTPQGSVKQDTMKRGEDLRTEVFYSAGFRAINGDITPFDISIIWHVENRLGKAEGVELTIPSTLAIASSGDGAYQGYAIIKYCGLESDARFLVAKLLGALPDGPQA